VSRWWPERVEVVLAPDAVRVARAGAGRRARAPERAACVPTGRTPDALLAALDSLAWPAGARVDVRLSSHLVRFHLLTWNDALATDAELEALARVELDAVHGELARAWTLSIAEPRAGEPVAVAAIDTALVDGLRAHCAARRSVLASVTPAFSAAAPAPRRRARAVPGRSAFAWCEPGRVTLAVVTDGKLQGLANPRAPRGAAAALATALAARADDATGPANLVVAFAGAREPLPPRFGDWHVAQVDERRWADAPAAAGTTARRDAVEVLR
jgi:hypothetical protein